jgi:hypothetical protein
MTRCDGARDGFTEAPNEQTHAPVTQVPMAQTSHPDLPTAPHSRRFRRDPRTALRRVVAVALVFPIIAVSALALPGCVAESNDARDWALVSRDSFVCTVEPVLERECSMPACHGAPSRRMRVLSPGRMRLAGQLAIAIASQSQDDREAGLHPALTSVEIDENFAAARAMLLPGDAEGSPLLDKPLAIAAGGGYHAPAGDVFATKQSAGYLALRAWAQGKEGCP